MLTCNNSINYYLTGFHKLIGGAMSKKYTVSYERPDELGTFIVDVKAKTDEEAEEKFKKQYPDWTVVSVDQR
jgi:hypothetical protein